MDLTEHFGVESIQIDEMMVGVAKNTQPGSVIELAAFPLEGWGQEVTYHERLKPAYYALQKIWTKEVDAQ